MEASSEPPLLVAVFAGRHHAEETADALRRSGVGDVWLGATEVDGAGEERLQPLDPLERAARWIRFAGDERLTDALRSRGASEPDVRRVSAAVPAGACILIASGDGLNVDALATVARFGGILVPLFGADPAGEG